MNSNQSNLREPDPEQNPYSFLAACILTRHPEVRVLLEGLSSEQLDALQQELLAFIVLRDIQPLYINAEGMVVNC